MSRVKRQMQRTYVVPHINIQGQMYDLYVARIVFRCIHCLGDLEIHNHGLRCTLNDCHYGFIHRDEAAKLTTEERFMKISDMFPSEYLRGVDVTEPRKMKIIKVTQEMVKNRETNQMEPENILFFEGEAKKMRLNITTTKEVHFGIFGLSPNDEPSDTWPGKYVTIEWAKTKAFGKTQIVPKVRKPKSSDKIFPPPGKEKALNTLTRNEFWTRVKRDLALPVCVSKFVLIQAELDGDYKQENAPKMWKVLEKDGQKLDQFLDMILADVPYYRSKDEVLAVMDELNTGYEFSEDFEAELSLVLDKHAKDAANSTDAQDDESSPKEDEPSLDDIFSDTSTEKIQEDELPF